MAFGFPHASYEEEIATVGDRPVVRDAVLGTFNALRWNYHMDGPDQYVVSIGGSGLSWGEELTVILCGSSSMLIKSKCAYFQAFDWGKNKRNVNEFRSRFLIREVTLTKIAYDRIDQPNDDELTPVEKMIDDREA